MSIERIKRVMSPPEIAPVKCAVADWQEVEGKLGVSLPEDYKIFIDEYGYGSINNFLWIFNPFVSNQYINLLEQAKAIADVYIELRENGDKFPYLISPTAGGCIPFGATDNGDYLFWKMGKEGVCGIVINEGRSPLYDEYDMEWSEFLYLLLTSQLESEVLPMNTFKGKSWFTPH